MRNPLRNLGARPSDKPTLRERFVATRERWRRRPVAAVEPRPDPIFDLIEEAWRLTVEHGRLHAIAAGNPDGHPSWEPEGEAHTAMWQHIRGTLLKTVPTTAAGCIALVRFTCEFTENQGVPIEIDSNDAVLHLIARSPAL